jgi:DtxR family Mn-dependent transcriptional regulator
VVEKIISCHDPEDEILEAVWTFQEEGKHPTAGEIMSRNAAGLISSHMIEAAVARGLLKKDGEKYTFTEKGQKRGEDIIRRHRLAERLLVDVLNVQDMVGVESNACAFEHCLSPEVTDSICTLLGHPRNCPHGNPIPMGPCCLRAQRQVESAVVPLAELRAGESGKILYISTHHHKRLDRLTSLGIFPGRVLKVHQRDPLFVIFLDETQLALERGIVKEIYVLRS